MYIVCNIPCNVVCHILSHIVCNILSYIVYNLLCNTVFYNHINSNERQPILPRPSLHDSALHLCYLLLTLYLNILKTAHRTFDAFCQAHDSRCSRDNADTRRQNTGVAIGALPSSGRRVNPCQRRRGDFYSIDIIHKHIAL
jgi:hypothetical protein